MQEMFSQGAVLIFGATGGIGQHVVMEFAKAGADLALIWRSKEDVAKNIAAQVEALGRKVSLHHCDVTEDGAAARAVAEAAQAHGRIHTLVWGAQWGTLHHGTHRHPRQSRLHQTAPCTADLCLPHHAHAHAHTSSPSLRGGGDGGGGGGGGAATSTFGRRVIIW